MTMILAEAPDIGATIVSPLVSTAECQLPANVNAAAMSPDGSWAVFGLGDGTVQVLALDGFDDGPGQTTPAVAFRHRGAVTGLKVTAGGIISAGQDGKVVRCAPPRETKVLMDLGDRWIDGLAVDLKTGCVAAACRDRIVICDGNGAKLSDADGFPSTISGLSFAPDGKRLAVSHLNGVSLISVATSSTDLTLEWKGSQTDVTWSPDGRFVVTATQDRELHIWDLVTMQDFRLGGYRHKVHEMRWSPDAAFLFCTGADVVTAWSFDGTGPAGKPPVEMGYVYDGLVTTVAAHPARPIVAGGYSTGAILVGGVTRGEAIVARAGGAARITALSWSPDGRHLLAGSEAGKAVLITVPDDLEL